MVLSCLPVLNPMAFTGWEAFQEPIMQRGKEPLSIACLVSSLVQVLLPVLAKMKHCAGCFSLEKKHIDRILCSLSLFSLQG